MQSDDHDIPHSPERNSHGTQPIIPHLSLSLSLHFLQLDPLPSELRLLYRNRKFLQTKKKKTKQESSLVTLHAVLLTLSTMTTVSDWTRNSKQTNSLLPVCLSVCITRLLLLGLLLLLLLLLRKLVPFPYWRSSRQREAGRERARECE